MNDQKEPKAIERELIVHDDKARRVLNVAPKKRPNISFDELASEGLTIERLEEINVPVLKYATQLTIHGMFPETGVPYGVGGYKNLTLNENRSLGVKYSAVDVAKKHLIADVARLSRSGWWGSFSSTDFIVSKSFYNDTKDAKELAIAAYKSLPTQYYTGGKDIGRLMYGAGFYVDAEIGTIYEKDVWKFCKSLFGMSKKEYQVAKTAEIEKRKLEHEQDEREQAEREAEATRLIAASVQALINAGYRPLVGTPEEGYYVRARAGRYSVFYVKYLRGKWQYQSHRADTLAEIKTFEVVFKNYRPLSIETSTKWEHFFHMKSTKNPVEKTSGNGTLDSVTHDRDWTWVKFTEKPEDEVCSALVKQGGKFSGKRMAWYFTKHIEAKQIEKWITG